MSTPDTGRTYADGSPVPFPAYRCKSAAGPAHPCKRPTDHDGDHKCVCGKTWREVTA